MRRQERAITPDQAEPFGALDLLLSELQRSLRGTPWEGVDLEPMDDKGLAHLHVRLLGSGQLLRVPKQSQMGLNPKMHLRYEASCFRLVSLSTVTPVLHSVLPVSGSLPRGALIVSAIRGKPARLPQDLLAICRSLAAIHRVPVTSEQRHRLYSPRDPLRSMIDEVAQQARYLNTSLVPAETLHMLASQLEQAHSAMSLKQRPPCSLITFDAHPGNFLIDECGKAWMVDLEKCRISYPGFDLAHATLYTSTTWDVDSRAVLTAEDILQAYLSWEEEMAHGREQRVWHVPLRRLMWLWSVTWCAKWLALSSEEKHDAGIGQDWSASNNVAVLNEHVQERARHYLEPSIVRRVIVELDELARVFREKSSF